MGKPYTSEPSRAGVRGPPLGPPRGFCWPPSGLPIGRVESFEPAPFGALDRQPYRPSVAPLGSAWGLPGAAAALVALPRRPVRGHFLGTVCPGMWGVAPAEGILFDFGGTLDADGVQWGQRFYAFYQAQGGKLAAPQFDRVYAESDRILSGEEGIWARDLSGTVAAQVGTLRRLL